jgi:hypothetical protein
MNILIASIIYMSLIPPFTLFDFSPKGNLDTWLVVNDVVMGGRSNSRFYIGDEGHAIFEGTVSLENYGGFASVRYQFDKLPANEYNSCEIRLRGDGKRYQFRVKSSRFDRASYITYFETNGEWQTVKIPLSEMYPYFRGVRLNQPNYPGEVLEEIAFLIGNKKAERFLLEIDWIKLVQDTSR